MIIITRKERGVADELRPRSLEPQFIPLGFVLLTITRVLLLLFFTRGCQLATDTGTALVHQSRYLSKINQKIINGLAC